MIPTVLAALALLAASPDPDLDARLRLAAVPGVAFEIVAGAVQPAAPVRAPECARPAAGLCDINWESMPAGLVARRAPSTPPGRVLLQTRRGDALIVVQEKHVLVLFDSSGAVRRWPYFNYLLYTTACEAAGTRPPRFGDWSGSPFLHDRRLPIAALALLWAAALLLYRVARRLGRERPHAFEGFFASVKGLGASTGTPEREARAAREAHWARAGFARPLSGLLTLLASMLLLVGPYFALQSVLANQVQPFPEADGLWRPTYEFLWIVWLTFDLGTQTAFVKYFAEHRVTDPAAALKDVQFYVWWQVFSRLTEVTLLGALSIGWLPYSRYALYAPFVMLYGACYLPSVAGLGRFLCQALQRFDFYNLLDIAESRILVFVVPVPFILLGRSWGAHHPVYGEVFGAALGLGLGQLATNVIMMVMGFYVLYRLRVPLVPVLLAQFDRNTVRRQLLFGIKHTLGQEPYRLTEAAETLIIIRWLIDFQAWLGIRDLLQNRLYRLFWFAWGFYQSIVPAVSEALAAGKERLVQYYVARYFQYGFLFSATIFSLLAAVGPTYIYGAMQPQWWRAAGYLVLVALSGLLLPPAWISDSLQLGAGRPGTQVVVMLIEQAVRLLLYLLLIPGMQFPGIYVATLAALLLKIGVGWWINHTRIVPLRLPLLPTLLAPALSGGLNYLLWRTACALLAPAHTVTVLLFFFLAGTGSFFFCFFACGLCGGFDAAALAELEQAAGMSALVRPICRLLFLCARAGARLCPRPPPPLALAAAAAAEARELDEMALR